MNVDGLNTQTLLSNSVGLEDIQQAILAEDTADGDFATALAGQLAEVQLQDPLPAELENSKGTEISAPLSKLSETLQQAKQQKIAALTGTDLPQNQATGQEIDLQKTMQALQDVMQQISEATTFIEKVSSTVSDAIDHVVAQLDNELSTEKQAEAVVMPGMMMSGTVNEDPIPENLQFGFAQQLNTALDSKQKNAISPEKYESQPFMHKFLAQEMDESGKAQELIQPKASVQQDQAGKIETGLLRQEFAQTDPSLSSTEIADSMTNAKDLETIDAVEQTRTDTIDKTLPRLVSDLTPLNRQTADVKAEIPPMTKLFADPGWQQELGDRIIWMHSKSVQVAELRLNPQHLGPVTIRVDVTQDQTSIAFNAQHAVVRDALEAAIPRLREMLNGQQLNLVDVNVSQQSFTEQRNPQSFGQGGQQANTGDTISLADNLTEQDDKLKGMSDEIEQSRKIASHGLLNIFA